MKTQTGGQRKGAGRPQTTIKISREDAKTLRFLARQQGGVISRPISVEEMTSRLIQAEWHRYDDAIQKAVAKVATAGEPFIF